MSVSLMDDNSSWPGNRIGKLFVSRRNVYQIKQLQYDLQCYSPLTLGQTTVCSLQVHVVCVLHALIGGCVCI